MTQQNGHPKFLVKPKPRELYAALYKARDVLNPAADSVFKFCLGCHDLRDYRGGIFYKQRHTHPVLEFPAGAEVFLTMVEAVGLDREPRPGEAEEVAFYRALSEASSACQSFTAFLAVVRVARGPLAARFRGQRGSLRDLSVIHLQVLDVQAELNFLLWRLRYSDNSRAMLQAENEHLKARMLIQSGEVDRLQHQAKFKNKIHKGKHRQSSERQGGSA